MPELAALLISSFSYAIVVISVFNKGQGYQPVNKIPRKKYLSGGLGILQSHKRVYEKEDKEKWLKILVPDMMSSEESDVDDDDVNFVKILPWRANVVQDFLHDLDHQYSAGRLLMFMDDAKSLKRIAHLEDIACLEKGLGLLNIWSEHWELIFKVSKCTHAVNLMSVLLQNQQCPYPYQFQPQRSGSTYFFWIIRRD